MISSFCLYDTGVHLASYEDMASTDVSFLGTYYDFKVIFTFLNRKREDCTCLHLFGENSVGNSPLFIISVPTCVPIMRFQ